MRRLAIFLLPLTLTLTSCDQKAQEFAKTARAILDEYAARIDHEIQNESQHYERTAVLEVKDQHENLRNSMKADRSERRLDLAVKLEEKKQSPLLVRDDLRDYAQNVYTSQRAIYVGQLDATRQQLAQLQVLQASKDRVEALGKLLEALSKKGSLTDELSAIKQTVTDTKTDFDKLICDDIAKKITAASAVDKTSLQKLQTDRKCATK